MAHMQKFKSSATHAQLDHNARTREGTLQRENIDRERTWQNYSLGSDTPDSGRQLVLDRIEQVKKSHQEISGRKVRADAVEFGGWVITAPQSLPESRQQEFFQETHAFLQDRYGAENAPVGFVHMDESQPHMHVPVVPEKDGKLNGKAVFTRRDLQTFHQDLQNWLEDRMHCRVEILLDDDKVAEKALSNVRPEDFKKIDRARLVDDLKDLQRELNTVQKDLADTHASVTHLEARRERLEAGVKNPIAEIISDAQEASERALRLYGECQEFERGAKWSEYGVDDAEMLVEPLQKWTDQGVTIKKKLVGEPVVEMPLSQWQALKDSHNRLVDAYRSAMTVLKEKLQAVLDFVRKMPTEVPQLLRLTDLLERLKKTEPETPDRYRQSFDNGRVMAKARTEANLGDYRHDLGRRTGRKKPEKSLAQETIDTIEGRGGRRMLEQNARTSQDVAVKLARKAAKKKTGFDR